MTNQQLATRIIEALQFQGYVADLDNVVDDHFEIDVEGEDVYHGYIQVSGDAVLECEMRTTQAERLIRLIAETVRFTMLRESGKLDEALGDKPLEL